MKEMRGYLFADEAGNFDFSRSRGATRYFIVCAVSMEDCAIGNDLLGLRRTLAWDGVPLLDYFHASPDAQATRNRVFAFLQNYDFTVYAQVLEKSKAQPQVRNTNHRFYQYAWLYLLRYCMPRIVRPLNELMVTTAAIGTKKGQEVFSLAVKDVLRQTASHVQWQTAFWSAGSDPCLQIADYCTWAIQRKYESGDTRSYDLIRPRIAYEYDTWRHGTTHYY